MATLSLIARWTASISMRRTLHWTSIVVGGALLVAGTPHSSACRAEEETDAPLRGPAQDRSAETGERWLLLTNGQVLRGRVSLSGERYVVHTPRVEVRIPCHQVEHVCGSLEDGYRLKLRSVEPSSVGDHLRLALWCLRHGLLDEAEAEIERVAALEPKHPRLELLARELKLARQPIAVPAPPKNVQPIVSDAELDTLVRMLPREAVDDFSHTVQPILLNHCATANCHGPGGDNKFQMIRLVRGRAPSRRITQRNLQAVIAWIDREKPDQSRLLAAASGPHGGEKSVTQRTDAATYQQLADWVSQLTGTKVSREPSTVDRGSATLSQSLPSTSDARGPNPRTPHQASHLRGVIGTHQQRHDLESELSAQTRPDGRPQRNIRPNRGSPPADPFDPETFNERYHPKQSQDPGPQVSSDDQNDASGSTGPK